jgi:hypothetical protein
MSEFLFFSKISGCFFLPVVWRLRFPRWELFVSWDLEFGVWLRPKAAMGESVDTPLFHPGFLSFLGCGFAAMGESV